MADAFDVAGRLAPGSSTVEDVEQYVAACQRLGYHHPDLTTHPGQVRDRYSGEDGLDLRALEADHRALSAAASAAEEAARMQTDVMADLEASWSGRGATAAREFLWRSCQSANTVSAAVRAAASAVAALRDSLRQAVDDKARATEALDDGQRPHRAGWLAAATTVTTGGGDVATASELVDAEVTPFVDVEVGSRWVAAMRQAGAAVDAAYAAAIAATSSPAAVFGVPGALGPRVAISDGRPAAPASATTREPATAAGVPGAGGSVATVPAAAVGPAAAAPWSGPEAAALPPPTTPVAAQPMSATPGELGAAGLPLGSAGSTGSTAGSAGSGLGGFGRQLADLIGGLIGSFGDASDTGVDDLSDDETADLDDDHDPDDPEDAEADPDDPEEPEDSAGEPDALADDEAPAESQPPEGVADAAAPPTVTPEADATPEPAPGPPEPAPAPPAAQPLAAKAEPTPCEIAADELPQVGE